MTVALPPVAMPATAPDKKPRDDRQQNEVQTTEITIFAYILTGLAAIGGFLFGYDTGVVSGAMLLVGKQFELNTIWHEIIVSGTIAAAWAFSLVGGYVADSWGRKTTVLIASTVFFLGSVLMGVAPNKEILLVGRIVVGVGIGLSSMSIPVYIAECSHPSIRGVLVTVNNLGITMGQFISGLVCGSFSTVNEGWRYMLALAAVPAGVQFIGLMFMPESPRFLASRGRVSEAEVVLARLRGKGCNSSEEIKSILASSTEEPADSSFLTTLGKILRTKHTRRALVVGCVLQAVQQLSGINTVMYYSASIIQMAGVGDYALAIWIAAGVAGMNFICTFIGIAVVDKMGRRPLTLTSLAGVIMSLAFLGIGFFLMELNSPLVTSSGDGVCGVLASCSACIGNSACGFCFRPGNTSCLPVSRPGPCESSLNSIALPDDGDAFMWASNWCPSDYPWIPIVGLCLYLLFFAPGMGAMPWTINSEIHPMWARGVSTSITTACNWLCNLVISLSFLSLTQLATTYGAFFIYTGISFVGFCVLWAYLPETGGMCLENMSTLFGSSSKDIPLEDKPSNNAPFEYKAVDSGDVLTS